MTSPAGAPVPGRDGTPLLEVRGLTAHHGQLRALTDVSLSVSPGDVYAIIGANGAGKSTLLRCISGLHRPTTGSVLLDGDDVTGKRPERRLAAGIAMVPEGRRLFGSLTVEENLLVGASYARPGPWTVDRVYELFSWMRDRRTQRAAQLSGGEQQSVAIGRALVANPRLLLLDELSLGLAPVVVRRIYGTLPELLAAGVTVLLVEQDVSQASCSRDPHPLPARGAHHAGRLPRGRQPGADRECLLRPGRPAAGRQFPRASGVARVSWVNAIIQGILIGGLYALFACGLSLMFGVMKVINLAHGDLAVVAGYIAVEVIAVTHIPAVWSFVLVVPIMAVAGYLLQRTLIQTSLNRGVLTTLLVTFGLSVVIENYLLQRFSANSHSLNIGSLVSDSFSIGSQISIAYLLLGIFVVAVLVLLGLQYFLSLSRYGRLIRAVADDQEAAQLSGVDYRHIFGIAAAIAFATVALAGIAYGMVSSFSPTTGTDTLLLFAFEAVVIGGLGSLWGTLVGGIILGVVQQIGAQINSADQILAGQLVFLLLLVIRPQGLTGRRSIA